MADRVRRWAPGLPSRRYRYMTARCPQGCDWWSIPPAVDRHVRSGNCKRQPWVLARGGELLISRDNHTRLRVLALLPPELVRPAQAGYRGYFPLARDRYLPGGVLGGTVLTSPFPAIPARRWLEVADAARRRFGPAAITGTLDRAIYRTGTDLGHRGGPRNLRGAVTGSSTPASSATNAPAAAAAS
jgi:hypothetical protein